MMDLFMLAAITIEMNFTTMEQKEYIRTIKSDIEMKACI